MLSVRWSRLLPLLALVIGLGLATSAHAQRTSGAVGLGGQLGEPSGITLKIYNANAPSYDFLAAWDLEDFFFLNGHALFEHDLRAENIEQELEWFIGPGAYLGIIDRSPPADDDLIIGISGTAGLSLIIDRQFEIYGQVTPRIALIPDTDGDLGGGLGFRYYF